MDTWILVADDHHASLMVQSCVGSLHEIESWDRCDQCPDGQLTFAREIAERIDSLQTDFDNLVVAAPPSFLENLSMAFGDSLNARVCAGLARDMTNLSCRQLRSELHELSLV